MREYLRIEEMLSILPDNQATIVRMHFADDLSFVDIAAILGLSPNTIKSRFRYAISKLRTHFKGGITMNQLKPKTRPTAPPSLKNNVMDRIQREQLYDKAVHKPQASLLNRLRFYHGRMLSAAALLLLIIGITCTLWPTERSLPLENCTGQVLNTIIQTVSPSLTM